MPLGARRNGQVDNSTNDATWARYVASWPAWREIGVCDGVCAYALVCGRARICVRDARVPVRITYALARLSAHVRERPPAPATRVH